MTVQPLKDLDLPLTGERGPLRITVGVVAWAGVLLQLWLSLRLAQSNGKSWADGLVAYLGYFTVLTNLFVALTLTLPVVWRASAGGRFFARPHVAACAATSITVVGMAYHFLLRHVWDPQGLQWLADVTLHYVTPLLYGGYWLFKMRKMRFPWWSPLAWSLYPLAYFAYALVRGKVLGVYPYPFIDVTQLGYAQTAVNAVGLLLVAWVVGWVLMGLARAVART